jgi:hypothetical protein
MNSQLYVKYIRCIDQVANKIPNSPARKRARRQVTLPYSSAALHPPSFPTHPGSSILIDSPSEGSLTAESHARRHAGKKLSDRHRRTSFGATSLNDCGLTRCDVGQIDVLPDDVLLEIFDSCADEDRPTKKGIEAWQSLVHVCRRWRSVVFGSPRRLNLRLVCTDNTPARDTLDVWPAFPLFIRCYGGYTTESVENIITVLKRSDRVCQIDLMYIPSPRLENVLAAMQEPFPELTHLELSSSDETALVLPNSFLGGSAPRLESLWLNRIPFPGLPKLLLSATHLVQLYLVNVFHSGYISPEAMVTALSTLTSLAALHLDFQSPRSRPDWASRRPPTPTRSILPVLTNFLFKGSANTWKTSWPASIPLDSSTWI